MSIATKVVSSHPALLPLIVLGIVELALVVFCIVDIVRRRAVRGGHKWAWIVVVVLFSLIGSIVYLALGRVQPPAPEPEREPGTAGGRASAAADLLYGPPSSPETPDGNDAPAAPPPSPTERDS